MLARWFEVFVDGLCNAVRSSFRQEVKSSVQAAGQDSSHYCSNQSYTVAQLGVYEKASVLFPSVLDAFAKSGIYLKP